MVKQFNKLGTPFATPTLCATLLSNDVACLFLEVGFDCVDAVKMGGDKGCAPVVPSPYPLTHTLVAVVPSPHTHTHAHTQNTGIVAAAVQQTRWEYSRDEAQPP